MRSLFACLIGAAAIIVTGIAVSARSLDADGLKPVSSFDAIADKNKRAIALFQEAGKVIQSPRCVNCHPAGNRPLQGDDSHLHQPMVVRGEANIGAVGMRCTTCHGPTNFDPAKIPGHPEWHLAPIEMAWAGKSLGEICQQIKDPERNGGKNLEELVHHMSDDSLVGWGWHPGAGRTPAPGTQKEFGALIAAWVEAGADCPAQ